MSEEPSKNGADVLVIDDDAIMRDLVADWLEAAGYRVRKATSCRAWIAQLLGKESPALIVTDMFMPGPCGPDAIGRLKKQHPGTGLDQGVQQRDGARDDRASAARPIQIALQRLRRDGA